MKFRVKEKSKSKKKKGSPFLIGPIFVIAGIVLWYFLPANIAEEFRLRDEGIHVIATVVEDPSVSGEAYTECRRTGRRNRTRTCEYVADYSVDGVAYQEVVEDAHTRTFNLEVGDGIQAVVDPLDYQNIVELDAAEEVYFSVFWQVFLGILFPGLGVYMIVRGVRARKERIEKTPEKS